jgi:hypothetical protein
MVALYNSITVEISIGREQVAGIKSNFIAVQTHATNEL